MLRMCVLTVFGETDSSPAICGLDRFVGRYRSTLSSPGLSSSGCGYGYWSVAAGDTPRMTSRMSVSSAACAVSCRGRAAFGEAEHRAGVTDFAGAGPLVIERRERGAGFAGHPEAGLGGQQPAGHLARQGVRAL